MVAAGLVLVLVGLYFFREPLLTRYYVATELEGLSRLQQALQAAYDNDVERAGLLFREKEVWQDPALLSSLSELLQRVDIQTMEVQWYRVSDIQGERKARVTVYFNGDPRANLYAVLGRDGLKEPWLFERLALDEVYFNERAFLQREMSSKQ